MDKVLSKVISNIKEDMRQHAEGAMNLPTPDLQKYCEVVGAYRGMQHALDVIEAVIRDVEEVSRRD